MLDELSLRELTKNLLNDGGHEEGGGNQGSCQHQDDQSHGGDDEDCWTCFVFLFSSICIHSIHFNKYIFYRMGKASGSAELMVSVTTFTSNIFIITITIIKRYFIILRYSKHAAGRISPLALSTMASSNTH